MQAMEDGFNQERENIQEAALVEKAEAVAYEKHRLTQKLQKLQHINADIKAELLDFHKVENELNVANEELAEVKPEFFKAH